MKTLYNAAFVSLLLLPAASQGQSIYYSGDRPPARVKPMTSEQYQLVIIEHIMSSPTPIGSVQLARMGDSAAVYVNQVLQNRPSLTPREQSIVVDMLHRAFETPAAISPQGRGTAATIALLEKIAGSTQDFSLRLRIADTKDFVSAALLATPKQ